MQCSRADLIKTFVIEPALLDLVEKPPLKETFRIRQMFRRHAFRAHKNASPVAQYGSRRALRIECRGVPIAADNRGHRRQCFQMIENYLHLSPAVRPRAVGIKMDRDGTKRACGMFDLGK